MVRLLVKRNEFNRLLDAKIEFDNVEELALIQTAVFQWLKDIERKGLDKIPNTNNTWEMYQKMKKMYDILQVENEIRIY